jgi:hypothetical protein
MVTVIEKKLILVTTIISTYSHLIISLLGDKRV